MLVIGAQHYETPVQDLVDISLVSLLHGAKVFIVIQVIVVDVGNDGAIGRQLQKGTVALVRFRHQIFSGAQPGIAAHVIDLPADDEGGIKAIGSQHEGDHGTGCSLAMGPDNRYSPVFIHQPGQ